MHGITVRRKELVEKLILGSNMKAVRGRSSIVRSDPDVPCEDPPHDLPELVEDGGKQET